MEYAGILVAASNLKPPLDLSPMKYFVYALTAVLLASCASSEPHIVICGFESPEDPLFATFIDGSLDTASKTFSLSGYLHDAENEEPLPGATVWVQGTEQGVSTGRTGFFSLEDVAYRDSIVFRFIGFKDLTASVQDVFTLLHQGDALIQN